MKTETKFPFSGKTAIGIHEVPGQRGFGSLRTALWHARGWIFLAVSVAILLTVLWWNWQRGWAELEANLENDKTTVVPEARVPTDVMEKLLIHRVDPEYPAAARPENLQGVIVLDVVVGSDGAVLTSHAQNGPEVLAQAAMDALRWWRFEPYRVNGKPVAVATTIAMEFRP